MAGLIRALFGGRSRPPDPDPLPGAGGYRMPTGRTGEGGFPGSTSMTRRFKGTNPRNALIRADTNTGFEQELGATEEVRQASYRGDVPGASTRNPRLTSRTVTPQTRMRQNMQNASPGEFFGGPALKTGPGNDTAGGNLVKVPGQANPRDTETPATRRQPIISTGTPGANNVRNEVAQRYKAIPGQVRTYRSASRADQARLLPKGQNADGSVHPDEVSSEVAVPSRFVFADGGVQTWYVERQMPYTGRGNGARGADLNGHRYYAEFNDGQQFMNAGQGNFGIERQRGSGRKRPVSFTEPAPWTANYYDTTEGVGTTDDPGVPAQAPNQVYISPSAGRASNSTGRI